MGQPVFAFYANRKKMFELMDDPLVTYTFLSKLSIVNKSYLKSIKTGVKGGVMESHGICPSQWADFCRY